MLACRARGPLRARLGSHIDVSQSFVWDVAGVQLYALRDIPGGEIFQVRDVPRVVAKYSMTLGGSGMSAGALLIMLTFVTLVKGMLPTPPTHWGVSGRRGGGLAQISVTPGGGSGSGDGERIFP